MKRITILAYALSLSACHVTLFPIQAPIANVCVPTSKAACPKARGIAITIPVK